MRNLVTIAVAVVVIMAATVSYAAHPKQLTVLAFTATWCGQCQRDHLLYPQLEKKYCALHVYDWDQQPEAIKRWGIKALPVYIVLDRYGRVVHATTKIQDLL